MYIPDPDGLNEPKLSMADPHQYFAENVVRSFHFGTMDGGCVRQFGGLFDLFIFGTMDGSCVAQLGGGDVDLHKQQNK